MKKILCMEISNRSVRCIETGTNNKTSFKTEFEFGQEIPDNDNIEKFKSKLQSEGIKSKTVVIFPHLASTIERNIEVPVLKQNELLKYIELNSRDYFPISIKDYVMFANIISKDNTKMTVTVSLLLKSSVEMYQKTMKLLGFLDIKISLGCPPFEIEPSEKYVTISMLDNELTLKYYSEGETRYSRSELIETTEDVNGIFIRFDDNITSQFYISIEDLQVYVFGDNKRVLESKLQSIFGIDFKNDEEYDYEFDYLKGLSKYSNKGKITTSSVIAVKDVKKAKSDLIKMSAIVTSGVLVSGLVFYGCYVNPMSELQKLEEDYEKLLNTFEISQTQVNKVDLTSQASITQELNTYNNNFFTFIDELKAEMPSSFVINNISISSESVNITVYLDSLESCATALHKMNNLEYASRGEVSTIMQNEQGYSFTVTLYYKSGLKN